MIGDAIPLSQCCNRGTKASRPEGGPHSSKLQSSIDVLTCSVSSSASVVSRIASSRSIKLQIWLLYLVSI